MQIFDATRTAAQLIVTFYEAGTAQRRRLGLYGAHADIVAAALAEEQIHEQFFASKGGKPLTSVFSFPHGAATFERLDLFAVTMEHLARISGAGYLALTGQPTAPLVVVVWVGLMINFALSIIFGLSFGTGFGLLFGLGRGPLVAAVARLKHPLWWLLLAASIFGLVLWPINFYGIAPAIGWVWFQKTDAVVQFFGHTFFFGLTLGLYLALVRTWWQAPVVSPARPLRSLPDQPVSHG